MKSIRKTRHASANKGLALHCLLAICLLLTPACDCTSPNSSGDAKSDDDSVIDDDSLVDDDAGTTSTTTTTTRTGDSTTTTTHVTTTSTTTTTIGPPGTACNPFLGTSEVTVAPRYGPWPAFELNGVSLQQIAGGVRYDTGPSDVIVTSDGVVHLVIRDGTSLDHIAIDENGTMTREVIHPLGGERKILAKDAVDHLYLAYTYRPNSSERVEEIRFATNKSGDWEVTTLLAVDGDTPDLDMAVDANGVAHLIYNEVDFDDMSEYYATWDGETFTPTLLEGNDVEGRVGSRVALDAAGSPHLVYADPNGMWYLTPDGQGGWNRELLALDMVSRAILFDAENVPHIAAVTYAEGHLFQVVRSGDAWSFEPVDECRAAAWVNMMRDAAGHTHFVYTDGNYDEMYIVSDETGDWSFTKLFQRYSDDSWQIAADVSPDGVLRILHYSRPDSAQDRLYFTTNADGNWKSIALAGAANGGATATIRDEQGRLHAAIVKGTSQSISYGVMTQDGWTESFIEDSGAEYGLSNAVVRLDSQGVAHVFYGNDETATLRHAVQTETGWDIENVHAGNNYGTIYMEIGSDDVIHGVYTKSIGGTESWYTNNESGTWVHEMIDPLSDPNSISDFMLGAGNLPICTYNGVSTNGLKVAKREGFENWTVEDANPAVESHPVSLAQAPDESLRLFACTNGECWLSSDETGNWITEQVPYGSPYDQMVVDDAGFVHLLSYTTYQSPGLKGTIYQTNMSGEWEWKPIFTGMDGGVARSISILQNGNLFGIFGAGGQFTAEFAMGVGD